MVKFNLFLTLYIICLSLPITPQPVFIRTFGGELSYETGNAITFTVDNAFIVVGETSGFDQIGAGVYIIKINESGDLIWQKSYFPDGEGKDITNTPDGHYMITGRGGWSGTNIDLLVMKINTNGDTLWTNTFDINEYDIGNSIKRTRDNGFIIAGFTGKWSPSSDRNIYLLKIDVNGNKIWDKIIEWPYRTEANAVLQASDGGFIITGFYFAGNRQFLILKTDSLGNEIDSDIIYNLDGEGFDVIELSNGDFAATGFINRYPFGLQACLVYYDTLLNRLWTSYYGEDKSDVGYTLYQTGDRSFIIGGSTNAGGNGRFAYLIKTDSLGNLNWHKYWGNGEGEDIYSLIPTADNGFILAGKYTTFIQPDYVTDVYIIKTDSSGRITTGLGDIEEQKIGGTYKLNQNFPNPFNPATTIEYTIPKIGLAQIEIYNTAGQLVKTVINQQKTAGEYTIVWNGKNLQNQPVASGIYFYVLKVDGIIFETKKMVLLR